MLHEIWPERNYCGPAALMAITGLGAKQEIRAAINEIRGAPHNRGVMGMYRSEITAVLEQLNVPFEMGPPFLGTLAKFISLNNGWRGIVAVTGHYVAVDGQTVADTRIRFGCDISEHPSKRKQVRAAWKIEEVARIQSII